MPRRFRGRHHGRHRRPTTHHVPLAVGAIALATAASGALSVGAAADTGPSQGSWLVGTAGLGSTLAGSAPLSVAEAAEAVELRRQDAAERSLQRARLTDAAAAAESAAVVDALTAERATRAQVAADQAAAAEAAAAAAAAAAPSWVLPVDEYVYTSPFGPRWGRSHQGLDFAAPTGTPIRAMGDGEIIEAAFSGGYGQRTVIRHADGTEIWYCHQSAFEVTSGAVTAGQVIGYVGSTGNSTGPHLHLEVHPAGGDAIDPAPWAADKGLTLGPLQ